MESMLMGMDADYAYRNFIQPERVPPPHKRTAYTGTGHYLDCIAKQILAEYWEFLRSNSGEFPGWRKKMLERYRVTVEYTEDDKHCGETLLCVDAEKEHANESSDIGAIDKDTQLHDLYGHLGVFCGRLCVLLGQNDQGIKMHMGKSLKSLGFGDLSDDLHTDPRMLYSYGFIGDFIRELKACIELENLPYGSRILTSLANPNDRERVRYSNIAVSDSVPINDTQQEALASLQYNIEGIQGPPGTGKSTTIFHFVNSCVGAHQTALVLCVQNKAVDAIAEKLCENATELPFMVIGHTGRIGETAKEWTLDAQIARRPEVVAMTEKFHRLNKLEQRLSNACQQKSKIFTKERADVRARQLREYLKTLPTNNKVRDKAEQEWKARRDGWAVAWKAYLFRKYWLLYGMHEKVEAARRDVHDDLKLLKLEVKRELIENARAVLCTVQTVAGREFHDADMQPFRDKLVAVVIDEAGTVPETKLPLIAQLSPVCVVAIGDHKQLPPFTHLRKPHGNDNLPYGYFQRLQAALPNGAIHTLTTQYRMHPQICDFVSSVFYDGNLDSDATISNNRLAQVDRGDAIHWFETPAGTESQPPGRSKSCINEHEVDTIVEHLLLRSPEWFAGKSVMITSFYKAQVDAIKKRLEEEKLEPENMGMKELRIVTVDAAQGSEADVVVISCVRSNGNIGFVGDPNRVCVAVSRARERLVVLGNLDTIGRDPKWHELYKISKCRE